MHYIIQLCIITLYGLLIDILIVIKLYVNDLNLISESQNDVLSLKKKIVQIDHSAFLNSEKDLWVILDATGKTKFTPQKPNQIKPSVYSRELIFRDLLESTSLNWHSIKWNLINTFIFPKSILIKCQNKLTRMERRNLG